MATLVCFHAHPDDEAIMTGGSMARAHAEGHRVVLVVATDGAHGDVPDDLASGETLADRRRVETERSASVLGVDRVVFLGYGDSGMTGWEQNGHDGAFVGADVDEAADRLAELLVDEQADVLTTYDWHGGYGHPDHVQVHRVGARAGELLRDRLPGLRIAEVTMNRDELRRTAERAAQDGLDLFGGEEFDADAPMDDGNPIGLPEAELTLVVDVGEQIRQKRAAILAHRSQVTDSSMFLQLPDEAFAAVFGREWYREHDRTSPARQGWFFS